MELLFREAAYTDIRYFVMRYEKVWRSTYRDTGIWSEDFFLEGVHASGNRLFDVIYDTIGKHLSRNIVIGRKKIRQDVYEVQFRIEERRLFVLYFDDRRSNARWVESISIGHAYSPAGELRDPTSFAFAQSGLATGPRITFC